MTPSVLSMLTFEPQITALAILAILASVFLGRVPALLKWSLALFVVVCLFPGHGLLEWLGTKLAEVLGPLLALGMVVLGLRMVVFGKRDMCHHCGGERCHGRCPCGR